MTTRKRAAKDVRCAVPLTFAIVRSTFCLSPVEVEEDVLKLREMARATAALSAYPTTRVWAEHPTEPSAYQSSRGDEEEEEEEEDVEVDEGLEVGDGREEGAEGQHQDERQDGKPEEEGEDT